MPDASPPDAVLAAALSERAVRDFDPLASRASYGAVAVDAGTGTPLVVKYTAVAGWRLRKEAAVLGHVAAVDGVPVPAVRSVGTVDDGEEWTYLLTAKCEGATGREVLDGEPGRAPALVRSVGRVLARLHEGTSFERSGTPVAAVDAADDAEVADGAEVADDAEVAGVTVDGTSKLALAETPTTWPGVLRDLVASMSDALEGTTFERSAGRARSVLDDHLDAVGAVAAPSLLHCDPALRNVHVADGALSCLLDWEYAKVGDPAYDLATAESRLFDEGSVDDAHRPALFEGYRAVRPVPDHLDRRRDTYRTIHALGRAVSLRGGSEGEGPETADPERSRRVRAELDRRVERLEAEHRG